MTVVVVTLGLMVVNATLRGTAQSEMIHITITVETWILLIAAHKMTVQGAFIVAAETHKMTVQGTFVVTAETHKMTVQGVPVVICKMVVGGHYLVVLAVKGPISAIPMPWSLPILHKSVMIIFSPSRGTVFFLCILQTQGSSLEFKLTLLRTMSIIGLASTLMKIHISVFCHLHAP